MGYQFSCMSPDIDEKAIRHPDPYQMPLLIAHAKADALLPKLKGKRCLLITSDQVILHNGSLREKPETPEECREFLLSYNEGPAEAIVGLVVTNTVTGKRYDGVATAKQYFHDITEEKISELLNIGDVMYCCGGFVVEQMTECLGTLEGEIETVQGLSADLTQKLLQKAHSAC